MPKQVFVSNCYTVNCFTVLLTSKYPRVLLHKKMFFVDSSSAAI